MAKNLTIAGANYNAVPGLEVPVQGGGTAYFPDTSDADATAGDIVSGKTAYVNGTKITGTGSGGGGSAISIVDTADPAGGTVRTITAVDLSSDTVTAAHLESGYTAHDAEGNPITGSLVPAVSTDFVVNLTYNGVTQMWEPDCTFVEIQAAFAANKDIVIGTPFPNNYVTADGYYDDSQDQFVYLVNIYGSDIEADIYIFDSNGLTIDESNTAIFPTGTINITSSGNTDVTNYATANVAAGSATAPASITATGASVSTGTNTLTLSKTVSNTPTVSAGYVSSGTAGNSSVSLTASVTTQAAQTIYPSTSDQTINSGRYLTGNQTIKGVAIANLSAENIKSGVTVTVGDSADADRITSVTGTYSGGGGKAAQIASGVGRVASQTYVSSNISLTVGKTGKYSVYWNGYRSSTSGTSGSQLYIAGTAYGSANTTFNSTYTNIQNVHLSGVSLTANQTITVYARSRSGSYYMYIMDLVIIEE